MYTDIKHPTHQHRLPMNRAQAAERYSPLWPRPKEPMPKPSGNRVLANLAPPDLALLGPHLLPVELTISRVLETANERIESIYFPDHGFASIVSGGPRELEVGIIGREGMTGLAVLLGQDRARYTAYIQAAGTGHKISAVKLRQALAASAGLQHALLGCVHAFLNQVSETAIANARSKNEERLARWLLMADDRIDGHVLPLTHKLLAIMLGVQRPAITLGLQTLERAHLIKAGRRVITVLDRQGLMEFANGAYEAPKHP